MHFVVNAWCARLTASLATRSSGVANSASQATRLIAVYFAIAALWTAPTWAGDGPAEGPGSSTERQERTGKWEVHFEDGIKVDEYARQLDFFGVELGVVDKSGKIQYASKLSARKPEKRISKKSMDKRMTISWKRGTLAAVDRKLLTKLGINTQGKDLFHFYPRDAEEQLYKLEHEHADPERGEATRTRFQVRAKKEDSNGKGGYEFFVVEQDFYGEQSEHKPRESEKRDRASLKGVR